MKKLNNLLNFKDFDGSLPTNNQKKTKRTDIGLDVLKEEINFDKIKEQGGFTEDEINILEESEFNVHGDTATGTHEDIDIKIEKDFERKIRGEYDNVMYNWSLWHGDVEFESGYEGTLNGVLTYLSKNMDSYVEQVNRYNREKDSYNSSTKLKKFFTFKPSLIEDEEDEEPFT